MKVNYKTTTFISFDPPRYSHKKEHEYMKKYDEKYHEICRNCSKPMGLHYVPNNKCQNN